MTWHILAIISGVLVAISAMCPSQYSDIAMGALVVIFASLALRSFKKKGA